MRHADRATGWPAELVELYSREYATLVRISAAILGTAAEAEEIVQDAIVGLHRAWKSVESPRAYLRRAVVNGSLGALRRRNTANRRPLDPAPPEAPSELVELRDILLRLPNRQRAAVVLRYVGGLSDADIAADLGVRRSTVRSLVARALATMRSELSERQS